MKILFKYIAIILLFQVNASCQNKTNKEIDSEKEDEIILTPNITENVILEPEPLEGTATIFDEQEELPIEILMFERDVILKDKMFVLFSTLDTNKIRFSIVDSCDFNSARVIRNLYSISDYYGITSVLNEIKQQVYDIDSLACQTVFRAIQDLAEIKDKYKDVKNDFQNINEEVDLKFDNGKEYNLKYRGPNYYHSFRGFLPKINLFMFNWSHYEDGGPLNIDIYGNEHYIIPIVDEESKNFVKIDINDIGDYFFCIKLGKIVDNKYIDIWKQEFNFYEYFMEVKHLFWLDSCFYFKFIQLFGKKKEEVWIKLEYVIA